MKNLFLGAILFLLSGSAAFAAGCPYMSQTCLIEIDTNAQLKAATGGIAPTIYRGGYYASGDGGDALYSWNGSSSCTDDGGSCIQPNVGSGRWILNANGAQSVKVFGAKCDDSTDDRTAFQNALAAETAVFVPANATCLINVTQLDQTGTPATGGGLIMPDQSHLFGQSEYTSKIDFSINVTPSYDFVAGGKFANIVVSGGVATVTTRWPHQMPNSSSVTISGSATTGLNGTKTITATKPDQFTYTTTAPNGTYTDPTHITGPSGIGLTMIRGPRRDNGNANDHTYFDLDNIRLYTASSSALTWVDLSNVWGSRLHHINLFNNFNYGDGQTFLRCADEQTLSSSHVACFFNSVREIGWGGGTVDTWLHHFSNNNNACCNSFSRGQANARTFIDTTGTLYNLGSSYQDFYILGDGNASLGYDFYPSAPTGSLITTVIGENMGNYKLPGAAQLVWLPAGASDAIIVPNVSLRTTSTGDLVSDSICPAANLATGTLAMITDWNGSTANGTAITGTGGGSSTVIAVCTASGWQVH